MADALKPTAPSLKVTEIMKNAEAQVPVDEVTVRQLTDLELDDLSNAIQSSTVIKDQQKEHAKLVIQNQRELLKLQRQLPIIPSAIQSSPLLSPKPVADAVPAAMTTPAPQVDTAALPKTFSENVHDFSVGVTDTILPDAWTKNWSETQKQRAGMAITLGGVALAAWALYSWSRGKEAAQNTEGSSTWKWIVGLGVAGLAGVGLYQIWKKYQGMQETLENLNKQLKETKDATAALTGKAREAADRKVAELEKKIAKKETGKTLTEKASETAGVMVAKKAFGLQYDLAEKQGVRALNGRNTTLLSDAREFLDLAKDARLQLVTDCINTGKDSRDKPFIDLINAAYPATPYAEQTPLDQERHMKAAKFIVSFFKKYQKEIEAAGKSSKRNLQTCTIAEGLDFYSHAIEGTMELADALNVTSVMGGFMKGGLPAFKDLSQKLFRDTVDLQKQMRIRFILEDLKASVPSVQEKTDEEFDEIAKQTSLFFVSNSSITLNNLEEALAKDTTSLPETKDMIHALAEILVQSSTIASLQSSVFIPVNDGQRTEKDRETAEAIDALLTNGDIPLGDAFQLFYLLKNKNVSLLLTYKVIDILHDSKQYNALAVDRYHNISGKLMGEILSSGLSIDELAIKMNLTEEQKIELNNMLLYIQEKTGGLVEDTMTNASALVSNNKLLFTALMGPRLVAATAGVVGTATNFILPVFKYDQWAQIRELSNLQNDHTAVQAYIKKYKIVQRLQQRGMTAAAATLEAEKLVISGRVNAMAAVGDHQTEHLGKWAFWKVRDRWKDWWRYEWEPRMNGMEAVRDAKGVLPKTALQKVGTGVRVGLGTATVALTAYEYVDYIYERQRISQEMSLETDATKRDMLWHELRAKEYSLAADTIGGGMLLTGVGTIPATALLLANMGGQMLKSGIDEGVNYTLLRQKDFANVDQATILETIDRSSRGYTYMSRSQALSANLGMVDESVKTANQFVRGEAYRAYFEHLSHELPDMGEEYLTDEEHHEDRAKQMARLGSINADQRGKYISAAEEYIRSHTEGKYTTVTPDMLRNAEMYARIVAGEWRACILKGIDPTFQSLKWSDTEQADGTIIKGKGSIVAEMITKLDEINAESLQQMKDKRPSHFIRDTKTMLLVQLTHELSDMEMRIRTADFDGLEMTGGEGYSENVARLTTAYFLQKALAEQVDALQQKTSPITASDVQDSMAALRQILSQEPLYYQRIGRTQLQWKEFGDPSKYEHISSLLSPGGMVRHIEERGGKSTNTQESQSPEQLGAVTMTDLMNPGEDTVRIRGTAVVVKGAKGYKFLPSKGGYLLDYTQAIEPDTDDPITLPFGTYAIYLPGEKIPTKTLTNETTGPGQRGLVTLEKRQNQRELDESRVLRIREIRRNRGEEILRNASASADTSLTHDCGSIWRVRYSVFDNPLYAYFDADINKWKVKSGQWITTDVGERRLALQGTEAEDVRLTGKRWAQQKYEYVLQQLASVNSQTE